MVVFLLKLIGLLSKSGLFIKLACVNLVAAFSDANILNSGLVIYLALWGILFSTSLVFLLRTMVVTKLIESGIF